MSDAARPISPAEQPLLLEWLRAACQSIRITPEPGGPMGTRYAVEVGNDETEWDYECAVMARCNSEQEAELVAAGLWALVDEGDR